jgi:hypothetical protein
MAVINTLQLAARKNLIQMSSDVTNYNYNSNCHSGLSRHLSTTCLAFFIPEKQRVQKIGLAQFPN